MMAQEKQQSDTEQARLSLRMSKAQKQQIVRAAWMAGQDVNSFAVSELLRLADAVLEKEEVRMLSDRDRDIFLALLDADPEPTEAAKKAAELYNQGYYAGDTYHFKA